MVAAEPYADDTFTLEGHEMRIIEQRRTDSVHSTSLHVPSIDLTVAGDVLYNQCHMFVGDTTPESRRNWIAALDRLAALHPKIAVAGHKKTGAPDLPSAIEDSKRYLEDFGRLQQSTTIDEELFNEMTKLYPGWESNQSWLMFGFPEFPNPEEDQMLRNAILGTWELVSYIAQDNHGGPITYPLGPDATGLIMYTADGYMSAQLMRPDRPVFDRPDSDGGTPEQAAAAAAGYLAYSGPFQVDESTGVVHHEVRVSLLPNWLNGTQLRHAKLDGDHLTLSASTEPTPGIETISTLLWKRARAV